MAKELLWKRAVRRGIEFARRNPGNCNFEQACELSAFVIENLRRRLAGGENLSEEEINWRVSLYHIESEQVERVDQFELRHFLAGHEEVRAEQKTEGSHPTKRGRIIKGRMIPMKWLSILSNMISPIIFLPVIFLPFMI